MKKIKFLSVLVLAAAFVVFCLTGCATGGNVAKVKPYPLDTCLVCGMKLGEMGQPCVFVYEDQEIKVCDKSEKADFDKTPDLYMKKLAAAEAEMKK